LTTLKHPASLDALKKYRQASALLQKTSRATHLAWYKEALALDFQYHIIVDGVSVQAFLYDRANQSWSAGLPVSEDVFLDSEKTLEVGHSLIKQVRDLKGRELGVVIHVADEFATAEIKPKLNNADAINDLREKIYDDPREVLEDSSSSPDQASWRVMPYLASGSPMVATTIRVSQRLESFVTTLRNLGNEENFPVVTHAVSAPLVAIMGLPLVVNTSTKKPFVAVLQYPWFTAMAFFNEHSDLRLIRSLQHRGQRCPANFWSSLATTIASLEFINPNIYLLPLGDQVDTKVSEDLRRNLPHSHIETASFPEVPPLPVWAPEPALSVADTAEQSDETVSQTFGAMRAERWFLQDFLAQSAYDQALFPSYNEIRLLRFFKIIKRVAYSAVLLLILWMALDVYGLTRKPEWEFQKNDAVVVQQKMLKLGAEKARLNHWNILLDDRAKAWSSMEMIARLFPEKSGFMLRNFNLVVRPEIAPKQLKAGFIKEWKITGLVRAESMDKINKINTREGITAKFAEISKLTGDASFDPTPATRSLIVNLKIVENPKFVAMAVENVQASDPSSYAYTFDLTIIQRFEATDKLAIPKVKAP